MRIRIIVILLALSGLVRGAAGADDAAPKKVALLVGVEQYLKPGFDDLDYCEDDVTAVGAELLNLGFDVTVLLGSAREAGLTATKANIEATTRRLVQPLGKQDLMLIMLSGHGQTLNPDPQADPAELNIDDFESYFCPYDAQLNDPSTQVALNYLLDDILAANVGRKLLVLDACRDIPENRGKGARNARGIDAARIDLRAGTSVYLSCSFGQRSFEKSDVRHGLFTYCLLEGLRGAAAQDGELAWVDLIGYVNRRMQSPEVTKLMPPTERQLPFPAGDLTHTVLGKLEIRRAVTTPAPTPQPTIPSPPAAIPKSISSSIGMKLNLIPAGEFWMGSPDSETGSTSDEGPQHRVRITQPFYLGKFEVTQREWRAVMGSNPCWFAASGGGSDQVSGLDTSDCPVETVSWSDAIEFCNRLSLRDQLPPYYQATGIQRDDGSIDARNVAITGGNGYRLPTEAEWEYACRAGTTTPFHFGTYSNGTQSNVGGTEPYGTNVKGPYLQRTTSVGRYPGNAFGLHDMHASVYEWCFDGYTENAYLSRSGTMSDPFDTSTVDRRVIRGGSWAGYPKDSRSADRGWYVPTDRDAFVGFRVARNP